MKNNKSKTNNVKQEELSFTERVIKDRILKTTELLLLKGKEYVRNNDKLHNFHRASEMERRSVPRVLHGMLQKHLVSYYDMLDDIDAGIPIKEDIVNEKLGDIIAYFLLQEAAIKETINKKSNDRAIK